MSMEPTVARHRERCFVATGLIILQLLTLTESFSPFDFGCCGGADLRERNSSCGYATKTTPLRRSHYVWSRRRGSLALLCSFSGACWKSQGQGRCGKSCRDSVRWLRSSVPAIESVHKATITRAPSGSSWGQALRATLSNGLDFTAARDLNHARKSQHKDTTPKSLKMAMPSESSSQVKIQGESHRGVPLTGPQAGGSPPSGRWLTSSHVLPSDPIERFSGKQEPPANRPLSVHTINIPSFLPRLVGDVRPRTFWGGARDAESGRLPRREDIDRGLRQLCAAITRVETRLGADSSEAGPLREALRLLQAERDAYSRELANEVARLESITQEYQEMGRKLVVTKAELSRNDRRVEMVRQERVKTGVATLSERMGHAMNGLGENKNLFSAEAAQRGEKGVRAASTTTDEITRAYGSRVREMSDGLAATQDQLTRLKSGRIRERRETERIRNQLTGQVAQLEAQLKRAGWSVELERAEMESVLQRLSSALAGVDVELTQSAGTATSRDIERALRRAREGLRSDRRGVKLLLERQKRRYERACHAMEEGAQRLRLRMTELNSLKARLVSSAGREKSLKSSVLALGGKVSALDNELRQTRDAFDREQTLRCKAEAALLSTEERRKQETTSLRHELEATRQSMASTRKVYESTVRQRQSWQQANYEEQRAKAETHERIKASELALRDEVARSKCSTARREREIADLKTQFVRVSRSLSSSEAERQTQTRRLDKKIENLIEEAKRLKSQVEYGKKAVARTVTGVSSRAFLNASQMSQAAAPQGLLAKLGDRLNPRPRRSDVVDTVQQPGAIEVQPATRHAPAAGWPAGKGILGGFFAGAEERGEPSSQAESTLGRKVGEGGSAREDTGNCTASRRAEATATEPRQKERNRPRREEEPHRAEPSALDVSEQVDDAARRGGSSTAAATCDEARGRDRGGLEARATSTRIPRGGKKDDGEAEAEADVTVITGSSAAATKSVTSSPDPRRQEATTDHMTVGATKHSESESTSATKRSPAHIGSAERFKEDRRCRSGTDSRDASTGPRPEYSVASMAAPSLPEEVWRKKSSRHIRGVLENTPPGVSVAADALRAISRAVFRGSSITPAEAISYGAPDNEEVRSSTKSKKIQSAVLQEGQRVSDDGPARSRRSRRSRDQAGRKRWYEVDVFKAERAPPAGRIAAPAGRESDAGVVGGEGDKAGCDAHGRARAPWAGLVGREKKDNGGIPNAVIASTLAATSHVENKAGYEGAETRRKGVTPELELQLHFVGVGG